jgi:lysophospholipase L1-like esterase
MRRPFHVLALGVALVLSTLGSATTASADEPPPPLPDSMAAIGDSITQAVDVCCFYGSWPDHSWSTGHAALDGVASHYDRILAGNPAIRGRRHNNAVAGARMADAPAQARRAVGQGAQYVTILMGANDLCGGAGTPTPAPTFRSQFQNTLDILRTGLPGTRVFVASIPDLHKLWTILRTHPMAQLVWHAADICPPMLDVFNTPADRLAVIDRQRELNRVLHDVCATWSNCRFDHHLTYDHGFPHDLVSRLDYFHPNLQGQATLAALTWQASWWGR